MFCNIQSYVLLNAMNVENISDFFLYEHSVIANVSFCDMCSVILSELVCD